MNALLKDIIREIRHSLGRFISIMAIVAIGTAFFAGVKASVPDIRKSADQYFDDYNLLDIRMMSTMGFSEEDVKAIKKVNNIEGIYPNYAMDFTSLLDTRQIVVKTIGWDDKKKNDPNYINQPKLLEGRLPQKENECLIEGDKLKASGFKIGDTIKLQSGTKDNIHDYLKNDTFTITGTCFTPDYLSYEKGSSSIGSGKVDTFIMIPQSNYVMEYYTEVLITVKEARKENCYSDDYFAITDQVVNSLEEVGSKRSDIRFEEIKKMATDTWQKNYDRYISEKEKAEAELKKAENQLEEAHNELILGQANLSASKSNFETLQLTGEMMIAQSEATITMYESQLQEVLVLKEQLQEEYDTFSENFEKVIVEEENKIAELEEKLLDSSLSEIEKQLIESEITYRKQLVQESRKQLEKMQEAVDNVNLKIEAYQKQIQDGKNQLAQEKQKLADGKKEAAIQFANAEKKLADGKQQYVQGKVEFEKNKKMAAEEFDAALEKLNAGKEQLNHLPEPTWYVLDRNSHYSYRDYGSVADRMDGIAKIFPLFFLLVAALVCLTTMTRMVDEQRGMIGTYKALGYSKTSIAFKYLLYALIASVLGSIVGCVVGMWLFPTVIFNAWNLMYNLPHIVFELQLPLAFTASASICGVTFIAAGLSCYKELVDVPALLMRPKAPKIGKTILLERIPFIWSRFSFTMKVTARNIFRYKKRFLMTVIGISGCTALLLAGFGIRDSISQLVEIQYEEIIRYDAQLTFDAHASAKDKDEILSKLEKEKHIKEALALSSTNASIELNNTTQNISIIVPDNSEVFKDYVTMRTRKGHEPLELNSDGAVVTEKLAKNLHASVGDTISIRFDDGISRDIKINAIMENYVGHAIYMTPSYYKSLTGYRTVDNTVLMKLDSKTAKTEATLGNRYIKDENVASLSFYRSVADSFEESLNSLSFVIYVLIGAAGMLAFVVLYNLTNVNISERLREIATIKVLGFYDKEVSSYVYRENLFLTFLGGFAGLALGIGLHALIMNLAEMPEIMFGRIIQPMSHVYALCITMLFAMIVNIVMYRKLQRIPMVESLKSVE